MPLLTRLVPDVSAGYQVSSAGPQFGSFSVAQQIQYAQNQKGALGSYIAKGGLKPLIGEWALAGERIVLQRSLHKTSWLECRRVIRSKLPVGPG